LIHEACINDFLRDSIMSEDEWIWQSTEVLNRSMILYWFWTLSVSAIGQNGRTHDNFKILYTKQEIAVTS
jgi:hypothetical protein